VRQSWTGPRLAGVFLLAASVAILIGVTAISGRGGYSTSGPRFVPLLVAIGLIALSALYLARTFIRPDVALAQRSAQEDAVTHWATPGLIMAVLLAYAFLLEPIGYPLATAAVFVALARLLGSRAIVSAGPMPGSTPTKVPSSTPIAANIRFSGVRTVAKPSSRSEMTARVVTSEDGRQPGR